MSKIGAMVVLCLVATTALEGCASSAPAVRHTAAAVGTVRGSITVTDSDNIHFSSQGAMPCDILSSSGYSDFRDGAEVDAVDSSGKVLAFGTLQPGSTPSTSDLGSKCSFPFTISGVPRGKKIYGLEFGRRGTTHYSEKNFFRPIAASIGG